MICLRAHCLGVEEVQEIFGEVQETDSTFSSGGKEKKMFFQDTSACHRGSFPPLRGNFAFPSTSWFKRS